MFECPLDRQEMEHLFQRFWRPLLKPNEDSLRAYPLDAKAKRQAMVYGGPALYEPPDVVIL